MWVFYGGDASTNASYSNGSTAASSVPMYSNSTSSTSAPNYDSHQTYHPQPPPMIYPPQYMYPADPSQYHNYGGPPPSYPSPTSTYMPQPNSGMPPPRPVMHSYQMSYRAYPPAPPQHHPVQYSPSAPIPVAEDHKFSESESSSNSKSPLQFRDDVPASKRIPTSSKTYSNKLTVPGNGNKRLRSANREDLVLVRSQKVEDCPEETNAELRIWTDITGKHTFYDCSCSKRRPIHDSKAIVKHIRRVHLLKVDSSAVEATETTEATEAAESNSC